MKKITSSDPESRSEDVVPQNLEALRTLFPDAFTEGHIDFCVLRELLGDTVDERPEKYGLSWHGKRAARQLALTPSAGTLWPCPDESVDWDSTGNLMIEGDNLEVLKLLQKSYSGRVKLIYIDPPYNTGGDFVYPDDFADPVDNYLKLTGQRGEEGLNLVTNPESSGRFHTNWLNMIYPRMRLARTLLAPEGFMVISIDDGEVGDLRLAADEVFGPENFIANVVWQKKYTRANDAIFFSATHDHLLFYAKDRSRCSLGRVERGDAQTKAYSNPDDHPKGPWKATPLHARSGSNTSSYKFLNSKRWEPPSGTYRRFNDGTMADLEKDEAIWFGRTGDATPSRKSFLAEMDEGMVPVTIWEHEFAGHNHQANDELKGLGLTGCFTSPKPTRLLRRVLELTTSAEAPDLVMDFFVGSGTFGDAVMRQNAADGGRRRYIVVQLPEPLDVGKRDHRVAAEFCKTHGLSPTIAELTKERLRRAGAGLVAEDEQLDVGFRLVRLDSSNITSWDPGCDDLEGSLLDSLDHIKEGRSDQDILFEVLLKLGLELTVPVETRTIAEVPVYSVGAGTLVACLVEEIAAADVEAIALAIVGWHGELDPAGETTVIFRDDAFEGDVAKTNMTAILEQHGLTTVRSL